MSVKLIRIMVLTATFASLLGLYATLGCRASLDIGERKRRCSTEQAKTSFILSSVRSV